MKLIAVDWGTSNLRAYLVNARGAVEAKTQSEEGILTVAGGDFEAVFERRCGPWLAEAPNAPVLLAGMIGSRQGWREVPYCACPAGAADIAAAMLSHRTRAGRVIHFVPGLSHATGDGGHDVMRGEETQILGAVEPGAAASRILCLPGTHSKWVEVAGGRVTRFATFMTGEVYGALVKHSILGRLMEGEAHDPAAFKRGLDEAGQAGGLLHHLFRVRTAGLFGTLAGSQLASYLSGIAIGHELEGALRLFEAHRVTLVGSEGLTLRYREALAERGIAAETAAEDAAARGLFRLAQAMERGR